MDVIVMDPTGFRGTMLDAAVVARKAASVARSKAAGGGNGVTGQFSVRCSRCDEPRHLPAATRSTTRVSVHGSTRLNPPIPREVSGADTTSVVARSLDSIAALHDASKLLPLLAFAASVKTAPLRAVIRAERPELAANSRTSMFIPAVTVSDLPPLDSICRVALPNAVARSGHDSDNDVDTVSDT
jgi:hypothetical protein